MPRGVLHRYIVALLLLIAVLAVCISPAVDLPASALRSRYVAAVFFWILAAVTLVLATLLREWSPESEWRVTPLLVARPGPPYQPALVDLTCSRLI